MNRSAIIGLVIVILCTLFYIPFLGVLPLFDWDEINFAESSREMLLTGNFFSVTVNFEPFWEKPPLFFWMQALSMKLFGVSEFAARLPNAMFGIITILTLFIIGRKHYDERFGLIWSLVYFGSFLPFIYFKSGIIDPVFNYFIFLSLYFTIRSLHHKTDRTRLALIAGALNGLAVLTKGPVGFLILLLALIVYLLIIRFKRFPGIAQIAGFATTFLLTTFLWYGAEVIQNGPWFLVEFIKYQAELFTTPVAGHEQPLYYHFVVVFLGCFPMSVLALPAFFRKYDREPLNMRSWMMVLFWVVMILFTIVKTKIAHYSSMAYLPISFLAALYIGHSSIRIPYVRREINWLFLILGILFAALLTGLPLLAGNFSSKLIPLLKDPFAAAGFSDASVVWNGWEFLIGVLYLLFIAVAAWFFFERLMIRGLVIASTGTAISLMLYLLFVVPKIAQYSQGPAVDFFSTLRGKDVYVTTIGYKSYAHYYYAQINPPRPGDAIVSHKKKLLEKFNAASYNDLSQEKKAAFNGEVNSWLVNGAIDKPLYFTTKITYPEMNEPGVELVGTEGGFRLYRRLPRN